MAESHYSKACYLYTKAERNPDLLRLLLEVVALHEFDIHSELICSWL